MKLGCGSDPKGATARGEFLVFPNINELTGVGNEMGKGDQKVPTVSYKLSPS